jgi:hypothetical protein
MSMAKQNLLEGKLLIEARITRKLWESAGRKLMEAQLTPQQIQQIFQQVEQGATSTGGNRTLLGKGKDAASAVNKAWEDLKTKVQNSGPIKNVDAMYDQAAEKLKQATGGDQGVMKYVQKYRDFAKKHPVAQSLIYSALIAAAGISGAGLGGAAALGLFKMVDKLLQGEKFSSAAYSGAKTGAMAYAAGQIGKAIKGQSGAGSQPAAGGAVNAPYGADENGIPFDNVSDASTYFRMNPSAPGAKEFLAKQAASLGAMGKSAGNFEESRQLSKSTIFLIIEQAAFVSEIINEGVLDKVKGKISQIGKNLTTKVTSDKLMQAWKKAGSPTDSDMVAKVLSSAGVPQETLSSVFTSMKIPVATDITTPKRKEPTISTEPAPAQQAPANQAGQAGAAPAKQAITQQNPAVAKQQSAYQFITKNLDKLNVQQKRYILNLLQKA